MRAIIQRVLNASVTVDGAVISSIGKGLCVLVGVSRDDTDKEMEYIVRKILNLRLFDDEDGNRWSKSVVDYQLPVLCVSQFMLYAELKGNKPDFRHAMISEDSKEFYLRFLSQLKSAYKPELIHDGQFGAVMQVHIQNDGPVTITLENSCSDGKGKKCSKDPTKLAQKGKPQKNADKPGAAAAAGLDSTGDLAKALPDDSNVTDKSSPAGDER